MEGERYLIGGRSCPNLADSCAVDDTQGALQAGCAGRSTEGLAAPLCHEHGAGHVALCHCWAEEGNGCDGAGSAEEKTTVMGPRWRQTMSMVDRGQGRECAQSVSLHSGPGASRAHAESGNVRSVTGREGRSGPRDWLSATKRSRVACRPVISASRRLLLGSQNMLTPSLPRSAPQYLSDECVPSVSVTGMTRAFDISHCHCSRLDHITKHNLTTFTRMVS